MRSQNADPFPALPSLRKRALPSSDQNGRCSAARASGSPETAGTCGG